MLSKTSEPKKQQGVVLAFALGILLILTIIGVATMSSTVMQERMAGIFKTQTEVFGEASSGVSQALDYYYDQIGYILDTSRANDDGQICGYVHNKDDGDWVWGDENGADFDVVDTGDGRQIERQFYCCQSWEWVADEGICLENPSRLFMLNRGVLPDGIGGTLAVREIEIRLAEAAPEDPTCAICIPGGVGSVAAPTSGAFRVDGACGPAIATETATGAANIVYSIGDKNIPNYDGGVVAGNLGSPWNDPVALAEFVFWAKLGIPDSNYYTDPSYSDNGSTVYGTKTAPQITYFDGDVSMGGDISGAGIMIVRGDLNWNGTPDFQGLLISLGGSFSVGGGGKGGNPEGSFVATNLVASDADDDLLEREILSYPVMSIEEDGINVVKLNDFDATGLGFTNQPLLRADDGSGNVVSILYDFNKNEFFNYNDFSSPLEVTNGSIGESLTLNVDGIAYLLPTGAAFPRDRFGRYIPDFLSGNWPPDRYGFNPNEWGWNPPDPTDLPFSNDPDGTNLEWKGGGKQMFKHDCRQLQRVRHQLLCAATDTGVSDLPSDFNYKDPDPTVCKHYTAANPYNETNIEDPSKAVPNHFSWHAWQPRCDCLGIGGDSDIIITGWRENIGWRDEGFAGCAALSKASRCPLVP